MFRKFLLLILSIIIIFVFPWFFYLCEFINNPKLFSEYISVIIGGLYGISLISVTIYSIVGNIIGQKTLNMSPTVLYRYKIEMIFMPLYILTCSTLLMLVFPNTFNDIRFVFLLSLNLTYLISVQSAFILEPYYNVSAFNNRLINKSVNLFSKKNKRISNIDFEYEILKKFDAVLVEYNSNDINSFFSNNDMRKLWTEFYKLRFNRNGEINLNFKNRMFSYAYSLFGNNFIDVLYDKNDTYILRYIIENLLIEGNNSNLLLYVFYRLHVLFEMIGTSSVFDEDIFDLLSDYIYLLINDEKYFNLLLNELINNTWNKKDAKYISIYYKCINNVYNSENFNICVSNEKVNAKFQYVMKAYNNISILNKSFGDEFDSFLRTCINISKGGK